MKQQTICGLNLDNNNVNCNYDRDNSYSVLPFLATWYNTR